MTSLEEQIAHSLSRRGERAPAPSSGLAQAAVARGRRRQRTRQIVAASGGVAAVVMVLIVAPQLGGDDGVQVVAEPAASGAPEIAPDQNSTGTPTPTPIGNFTFDLTPCSEVKAPPRDTEVDTVLFAEQGVLDFEYRDPKTSTDRRYFIDYRNDPTCKQNARLVALVKHAQDAAG